jgi:hypothetical protein
MRTEIFYTSDVSIEEHSNFVVFKNQHNGTEKEVIAISRDDDSEEIRVYWCELFAKPSDSWIDSEDLERLNSYADTDYNMESELVGFEPYTFTQDLVSYYGAENFDSCPLEFETQQSFEDWLIEMKLID